MTKLGGLFGGLLSGPISNLIIASDAGRALAGPMPAGGANRYMASAGSQTASGLASTNSSPTDQWNDQWGVTNAGQATTAKMPTYLTGQVSGSTFGCQAGYDAAQSFDGTDDYFTHTALSLGTAYSLIITLKYNGGGVISSATTDYLLYDNGTALRTYVNAVSAVSLAHGMTSGHWYTIGVRVSVGAVDWTINSTSPASLGSGTTGTTAYGPTTIGSLGGTSTFFNGEIAEMSYYARQLSLSDFSQAMTVHRLLYGTW